jgi:hypothetical protein
MKIASRLEMLAVIAVWAVAVPAVGQIVAGSGNPVVQPRNPYTPPPCVAGVPFADVTCSTFYDAWIEQFAADGITAGCGNGNYCPNENVTRAEMAVFIEAAMHGTANWTPGDLGNHDTGLGTYSLSVGPTGADDTGIGYASLYNTIGNNNAGVGSHSLFTNTTGGGDTAIGVDSLYGNTSGNANTGVGEISLYSNSTGSGDTAIGYGADVATADLSDATALGAYALVDASNHVRIGDANVTQIGGNVAWSNLSDARAKTNIEPLGLGLDFVMALRPVSFTLKQGNGRTDMGFIAQDVEALLGDGYNVLGIGGDAARTLSLRYTDFIAPMVKAIQEQEGTISEQRAAIAAQGARVAALEERDQQEQATIAAQQAKIAAIEGRLGAVEAALSGRAR